jgi:hypothetical protein
MRWCAASAANRPRCGPTSRRNESVFIATKFRPITAEEMDEYTDMDQVGFGGSVNRQEQNPQAG